jgi:hypothetical protein
MAIINTIIRAMGQLGAVVMISTQTWRAVLIVILGTIMYVEQEAMEVAHVTTIFVGHTVQA